LFKKSLILLVGVLLCASSPLKTSSNFNLIFFGTDLVFAFGIDLVFSFGVDFIFGLSFLNKLKKSSLVFNDLNIERFCSLISLTISVSNNFKKFRPIETIETHYKSNKTVGTYPIDFSRTITADRNIGAILINDINSVLAGKVKCLLLFLDFYLY
jgi:hypothetical protein